MSVYQIPVTNNPERFQITLAGVDYILLCRWNDATEGGWVIDILNGNNSAPIAANIPLVTGVNLLDGLAYLGIGGSLFVTTDGDEFAVPTYENLGIESFLYFEVVDV